MLSVPVTAEERALIEKKMQQMGTRCFSTYARKMLIDGYVIKIDYSDIKAMTAELQKIGTNINQIARRVNATGTIYAQDIEDIKGVLNEIWLSQRSIDYIICAAQASFFVAFPAADNISGSFQLPYCLPDRVNLFPVDKGQTFQRVVPVIRQGQHLGQQTLCF